MRRYIWSSYDSVTCHCAPIIKCHSLEYRISEQYVHDKWFLASNACICGRMKYSGDRRPDERDVSIPEERGQPTDLKARWCRVNRPRERRISSWIMYSEQIWIWLLANLRRKRSFAKDQRLTWKRSVDSSRKTDPNISLASDDLRERERVNTDSSAK